MEECYLKGKTSGCKHFCFLVYDHEGEHLCGESIFAWKNVGCLELVEKNVVYLILMKERFIVVEKLIDAKMNVQ
jgi:hypothetical protein